MSRTLRVLAVDQFSARADEHSWLEWIIQHDKEGRPYVMAEQPDGSVRRVNEGDFVVTAMNGERHAFAQADFTGRYKDVGTFITRIQVL